MKETIKRSYARYKAKGYKYWYWAVDVHDVIFKGDYKVESALNWVTNAKRALKIINNIPDIKVILYTSTRQDQTQKLIDKIKNETGLEVYAVNKNPDFDTDPQGLCEFNGKFCFDLMLDDKAGFDYSNGWEEVIDTLIDLNLGLPAFVSDDLAPQNKWVSLRKRTSKFADKQYDYIYSHEDRCGGNIIAVLPYRKNKFGIREYLFVREHNVLFGVNYTIITGGVDAKTTDLKKIREQAILELSEEAGIDSGVEFIRTFTSIKSNTNKYYLFTMQLSENNIASSSSGDGSVDELFTIKKWLTFDEALRLVNDPIALAALLAVEYKYE